MQTVEQRITHFIAKLNGEYGKRHYAVQVLAEIGEPAVLPLIEALTSENVFVRRGAAQVLGRLGDTRAVEPLIEALSDTRHSVREAVADALATLKDPRAIKPLKRAAEDEGKWKWKPATEALRRMQNPQPQGNQPIIGWMPTPSPPPKPQQPFKFTEEVAGLRQHLGEAAPSEAEICAELLEWQQDSPLSPLYTPPTNTDFNDVCNTVFRITLRQYGSALKVKGETFTVVNADTHWRGPDKKAIIRDIVECLLGTPTRMNNGFGESRKAPDVSYRLDKWYNGK